MWFFIPSLFILSLISIAYVMYLMVKWTVILTVKLITSTIAYFATGKH